MSEANVFIVHVLIDHGNQNSARVIGHYTNEWQASVKANMTDEAGFNGPYPASKFPVGSVVTANDLQA